MAEVLLCRKLNLGMLMLCLLLLLMLLLSIGVRYGSWWWGDKGAWRDHDFLEILHLELAEVGKFLLNLLLCHEQVLTSCPRLVMIATHTRNWYLIGTCYGHARSLKSSRWVHRHLISTYGPVPPCVTTHPIQTRLRHWAHLCQLHLVLSGILICVASSIHPCADHLLTHDTRVLLNNDIVIVVWPEASRPWREIRRHGHWERGQRLMSIHI